MLIILVSSGGKVSNISDTTDPYNAFDVSHCDTYEHLWTWDLEMSCGETTDYDQCHCTFAELLMEKNILSCEDTKNCPSGCAICSSCLRLLGCKDDAVFGGRTGDGSAAATTAALFTLLVGTGFCIFIDRKKKARRRGKLNAHLIDEMGEESNDRIWMVPIDDGVPNENGTSSKPVWLAPDKDSVSTDASSSVSTGTTSDHQYSAHGSLVSHGVGTKEKPIVIGVISNKPYQKGWKAQPMFEEDLFPDVLAPADQVLSTGRIPTVPTDKTSHTDNSSDDNDNRQENRYENEGSEYDDEDWSETNESSFGSVQRSTYSNGSISESMSLVPPGGIDTRRNDDSQDDYSSASNSSTLTSSLNCEEDSI